MGAAKLTGAPGLPFKLVAAQLALVHLASLCVEAAEAAAGVLAGHLISALVPPRWVLALARPALRAMRLGPGLAPAVVAAAAGPTAAAAALSRVAGLKFLEALGAVSIAVFARELQHWARAVAVLAALLGSVGIAYSLLLLAIALARLGTVCALCRLLLPAPAGTAALLPPPPRLGLAWALRAAARPAATVAAALVVTGVTLDCISAALPRAPSPWLAVAVVHAASAYAAYGVASAMTASGVLGPGDALRAMLAGTALSSLVSGWRRLFPQLLPLGARRAAAVTAASQGLYAALAALAAALTPS